MLALAADAAQHGIAEFGKRPIADPGLAVRRDIRHVERAEGAAQRQAAGHHHDLFAAGALGGMAAGTAAGPEQHFAARQIGFTEPGPDGVRQGSRLRQKPGGRDADHNNCRTGTQYSRPRHAVLLPEPKGRNSRAATLSRNPRKEPGGLTAAGLRYAISLRGMSRDSLNRSVRAASRPPRPPPDPPAWRLAAPPLPCRVFRHCPEIPPAFPRPPPT